MHIGEQVTKGIARRVIMLTVRTKAQLIFDSHGVVYMRSMHTRAD
jgi:hypothetical protein